MILLALFSNYAFAAEPLMNMTGIQCREVNFQYLNPRTPELIEEYYCSYLVGLKGFDRSTSYYGYGGQFSTEDNIKGYRTWQIPKLKKACEDSKSKAFEILKTDYPNYKINCSRLFNFDNVMNEK